MNLSYLADAFKSLDVLEEEDLSLTNRDDLERLNEISNEEPEDTIEVMSMDFDDGEIGDEVEEEPETHIGDVILDCPVCHSKLYKNHDEVVIDETEEFANVGEECPYCYTADGFKIVGQVAPYQEEDIEVEIEDKEDVSEDEVEEESEEVEESLNESKEVDLAEYQKWVDYDMKKYHKISDVTMNKIRKAGLSVVKDQYGEYEVIADRADSDAKNESLKRKSKRKIKESKRNKNGIKKSNMKESTDDKSDIDSKKICFDDRDEKKKVCLDSDKKSTKRKVKESKLTEKNWSYTLKSGSALRDAIDNEDYEAVKDALMDCYSELFNAGIIDEDDYDNWTEEIIVIDTDDEDAEDELDYQLGEFYDLCDNLNVWVAMNESLKKPKKVREGFEKVELETDDQKITVKSEPKPTSSDDLMITPIDPEIKADIDMNSEEIEDNVEGEENFNNEDVDLDVDEFEEDSFDEVAESYLRNVYKNVNSYSTSNVWQSNNHLIVEGMIKFASGKQKRTQFVFESKDATKSGKVRFIGENTQISRGKKSFLLRGSLNKGKFLSESLNYNYRTKDSSGKSQRVYGTAKVTKK